jgi:hypothetical protein
VGKGGTSQRGEWCTDVLSVSENGFKDGIMCIGAMVIEVITCFSCLIDVELLYATRI